MAGRQNAGEWEKCRRNTRNAGEMRDQEINISPSRIKHKEIAKHITVFYISMCYFGWKRQWEVERILTLYYSILG